jgi:hypothetical protein
MNKMNRFLDVASNFLAHRKGLLPILGILLVMLNFVLQFIPGIGFLATSNICLHFGVILAILGILLAWAL